MDASELTDPEVIYCHLNSLGPAAYWLVWAVIDLVLPLLPAGSQVVFVTGHTARFDGQLRPWGHERVGCARAAPP